MLAIRARALLFKGHHVGLFIILIILASPTCGKMSESGNKINSNTSTVARDAAKAAKTWSNWAYDKLQKGMGWQHENAKMMTKNIQDIAMKIKEKVSDYTSEPLGTKPEGTSRQALDDDQRSKAFWAAQASIAQQLEHLSTEFFHFSTKMSNDMETLKSLVSKNHAHWSQQPETLLVHDPPPRADLVLQRPPPVTLAVTDSEEDLVMGKRHEASDSVDDGLFQHYGHPHRHELQHRELTEFHVKQDICCVDGQDYFDRERAFKMFIEYMEIPPEKYMACHLRGGESAWCLQLLQSQVHSWFRMKQQLHGDFLPTNFKQMFYLKYQHHSQGNQFINDYTKDLYRLSTINSGVRAPPKDTSYSKPSTINGFRWFQQGYKSNKCLNRQQLQLMDGENHEEDQYRATQSVDIEVDDIYGDEGRPIICHSVNATGNIDKNKQAVRNMSGAARLASEKATEAKDAKADSTEHAKASMKNKTFHVKETLESRPDHAYAGAKKTSKRERDSVERSYDDAMQKASEAYESAKESMTTGAKHGYEAAKRINYSVRSSNFVQRPIKIRRVIRYQAISSGTEQYRTRHRTWYRAPYLSVSSPLNKNYVQCPHPIISRERECIKSCLGFNLGAAMKPEELRFCFV